MYHLPITLARVGGVPDAWFAGPMLPPEAAREEVRCRVDAQIVPHPVPAGREVPTFEYRID